jgi:predicted regulator of Ras-like GTPase activity (Roadblock/LC7/MglB family)
VSSKSSRSRILEKSFDRDQNEQPESISSADAGKGAMNLTDIPQEYVSIKETPEKEGILTEEILPIDIEPSVNRLNEDTKITEDPKRHGLQEITPTPFQGGILNSQKGNITEAFTELKNAVEPEMGKTKPRPTLTPIPLDSSKNENLISKQQKLEKDMSEVLSFLSKKVSVKKLSTPQTEKKIAKEEKPVEKLPPSSMNEILKDLVSVDSHIEATAIIKTDGTILASGISNRISESLFSTIGMNLSMIGTDIIEGLSAGSLKSISVRGSEGVLDLAPIDRESSSLKDMILILFSHPKVKSGIVSVAINIVKKQIKYYLGLKD